MRVLKLTVLRFVLHVAWRETCLVGREGDREGREIGVRLGLWKWVKEGEGEGRKGRGWGI